MAYMFLFSIEFFFLYFLKPKKLSGRLRKFKTHEILVLFVLILFFTLFYGLRYNVGIDYMSYYNNAVFNLWNKPQRGTGQFFEPGFRSLYAFSAFFDLPANTVFLFGGFLIYFFLFFGIKNYSNSFLLSIFVFVASGLFFFFF
ncbi:MAG: EpsG family protein [Treponema sp.]|nr:EpsG family protein [Treponema sp.]